MKIGEVLLLACGLGLAYWALWYPLKVDSKPEARVPSPCPDKTTAVYTTIEVCDLKHPFCFSSTATLNSSAWPNKDLENHLSLEVLAARQEKVSGRLRLRQSDALVHMEVLTCMSKAGPIESYKMATTARKALGGGTMRWSAEADLTDQVDEDLQQYFASMSNLSEHKELVASSQSNFSHATVWRIGDGTRLMLDNIVMSDSRDEMTYHEMLVHPALLVVEQPRRVLIIGGGEGATLREVLRDTRVQHVTMVDIDESLVKTCKEHLPMMHKGSFDSPKATVLFEDGVKFIQRSPPESFDVIIVDGIDFDEDVADHGAMLFMASFYREVLRTLRPGGMLVQYMSDADKDDTADTLYRMGFTNSEHLCVDIESFFGAGACFMLSSKGMLDSLRFRLESLQTRLPKIAPEGQWSYLTPENLRNCLGAKARRLKGARGRGGHSKCNDQRPLIATVLLPLAVLATYSDLIYA